MDSSTLLWTVNATRGSVNFGRLIPFAGNTYELVFAGVAIEEEYTAYVMDESGLKCLAKSEHNAGEYTIAFNTADLRGEFERNMHEMQTFHVIVRDSKRVVAEGDLSVQWQSLWEDTTTGEVFTMRGPKGQPGEPGRRGLQGVPGASVYEIAQKNGFTGTQEEFLQSLKGVPGSMVRVQKLDAEGNETGKWHDIYVTLDASGKLRIVVDKTEKEADANADIYINRVTDVKVSGVKTFLNSPIVPKVEDVDDDSGKAVSTSFLRVWWEKAKQAAQSISGIFTFSNRIVVKDDKRTEETLRVDAKEHTVTAGGKFVATGSEDHSGTENHYGKETHAGTVAVTGSIEDRTGGNLKTFTDLTLRADTAIEKPVNSIFDADENVFGEDKVFNNAEGFIGRIIGGVRRAVGSMIKTSFVKLGISSSGESIIQLYGDHINGTTEKRGTKNTTLATTAFVRDHNWMYPEDRDETASESGTISWQGIGSYSTNNPNMLVWEYTAQEDGYLELLITCMFYYIGSGYKIMISKADGTGEYLLDGRVSCYNSAWYIASTNKVYPLRAGQRICIRQISYYPHNGSYYQSSWKFYSKI